MKYTKGSLGRIFLLKFEDNEIFADKLVDFAVKERVKSACIVFIGALRKGDLAAGPKKPVIPPQPNMLSFNGGWEVMGLGTVFTGSRGPQIHIHTSMGKKNRVLTGCLRGKSKVFLVIEALVMELKGIKAAKDIDPHTGLNLLRIL
jgi:predicted DNA-binding protein with PD1-like motif